MSEKRRHHDISFCVESDLESAIHSIGSDVDGAGVALLKLQRVETTLARSMQACQAKKQELIRMQRGTKKNVDETNHDRHIEQSIGTL